MMCRAPHIGGVLLPIGCVVTCGTAVTSVLRFLQFSFHFVLIIQEINMETHNRYLDKLSFRLPAQYYK